MAGEIEVEVVVDGEVEGRYRLPLSKTPRQLLPYLLRDIGLPVVVGARRCFYKVDYRAKSRLRGDSEWLTLSPDRRLADATYLWAFAAITASPGARSFYDQRRHKGDTHNRALRALSNRLVGILHGCLHHATPYNEHTAWGHRTTAAA